MLNTILTTTSYSIFSAAQWVSKNTQENGLFMSIKEPFFLEFIVTILTTKAP